MIDEYFSSIFLKYKRKGVLIDSNLLLLYFIGKYSPEMISKFKRTMKYTKDDFYLMTTILEYFNKIVTMPNILTEVSNLSNQLPKARRIDFYEEFREQMTVLFEQYVTSKEASDVNHFTTLGLTDSVILKAAKGKYLVLTDEIQLYNILLRQDIDVININHLRAARWFSK